MKYSRTKTAIIIHLSAEEFARFVKNDDGTYRLEMPVVETKVLAENVPGITNDIYNGVPKNTILERYQITEAVFKSFCKEQYGDHRLQKIRIKIAESKR